MTCVARGDSLNSQEIAINFWRRSHGHRHDHTSWDVRLRNPGTWHLDSWAQKNMKRHKLAACNFYGTLHLSSNHDSQDTHSLESHWISCFNLPTSMQAAAACRGSVGIALAVDKFVVLPVLTGAVNCSPGKTSFLDGGGSWQMCTWACFLRSWKTPLSSTRFCTWINKSDGAWMNHTIGTQTKTNIQSKLFAWCAGAREMGKLNCQGP